jgi:hypothetical protein
MVKDNVERPDLMKPIGPPVGPCWHWPLLSKRQLLVVMVRVGSFVDGRAREGRGSCCSTISSTESIHRKSEQGLNMTRQTMRKRERERDFIVVVVVVAETMQNGSGACSAVSS